MDDEELKSSEMSYAFKITYHTRDVQEFPCQDFENFLKHKAFEGCKTPRRNSAIHPEDWEGENKNHDVWCFQKCVFPIDVKFLNKNQWELYLQKRSPEKKKLDYSAHPENEKLFCKYYPEIREFVTKEIIVS